ncbi:MAG: helix-turn-helix transcriptional regulator [Candidatus Pacebacteria bacterium]|nr:helix-turn-helix transcriptional regulator [Candidatus Paceibacterota bacterium]
MKSFFRALLKQGKDIKWLAKEIGVTTQSIYSWKTGKSKPKTGHMQKMAKVLDMDIDKIIDDFYTDKK